MFRSTLLKRRVLAFGLIVSLILSLAPALMPARPALAASIPPILVIHDPGSSNPFGRYLGEILSAEGIRDYELRPLADLNGTLLAGRRAVILAESTPSSAQVTALADFVSAGGGLIAMRPAASLASILGVQPPNGTTTDGYVRIVDSSLGAGLYADTMQFHGPAGHYSLSGASEVARLYSDRSTATSWPAVTLADHGSGRAAMFAYDLARSVVLTRQGNPAKADVDSDGDGTVRSIDLFHGGWIDLERSRVPQADIQQRLMVRLLQTVMGQPLPRIWYFPSGAPTVLVSTGDAHGNPTSYFQTEIDALRQRNVPMTFYLAQAGEPSPADVATWRAQGFDFAPHPYVDCGYQCGYDQAVSWFEQTHGTAPRTIRTHMVRWSGWSEGAAVEAQSGLGMDFNFYQWGSWLQAPGGTALGYITGSGLPMRFAEANGTILPIYQQHTVLVDEQLAPGVGLAGLSLDEANAASRQVIDASVDNYHTPITTQFHVDYFYPPSSDWALATIDYALQRGAIPLTADSWLTFVEQRAATAISGTNWTASGLSFDVSAGGPDQVMLIPMHANGGAIASVERDGSPVSYTTRGIDSGIYAAIPAGSGHYVVTYAPDTTTPTVTGTMPPGGSTGVSVNSSITVTFSEAMDRDAAESAFSLSPSVAGTFAWDGDSTTMTFTPGGALAAATTYTATVSTGASDLAGNPIPSPVTWQFTTGNPVPPGVTAIDPRSGPTDGGTVVTITGTDFTPDATVRFGGTPAASVTVNSGTSMTATTPAHTAGTVDVIVTTPNGSSQPSSEARFTFVAPPGAPTLTAVDPGVGPAAGGTSITLTGTNFTSDTTVTVGGNPATGVTVVDSTRLTATVPAGTAGAADVTVTNPDGRSATLPDGYTYLDCPSGCLGDATTSDFAGGTPAPGAYLSETADGEIQLAPTLGSEFGGTTLPSGWSASPWASGGGASLGNGHVTVDAALVASEASITPDHSLEFVATFDQAAAFQHAGLGTDLNSSPWAIFSTGGQGGTLFARSNRGQGNPLDTPLGAGWLGAPHRFRIEWTSTQVRYLIDGTLVATHDLQLTGAMRPVLSDGGLGGGVLVVDWLRLDPYAASASYTSRVLDSGGNATWGTTRWTADQPAGTGLSIAVRSGNTPFPHETWSAFQPVTNGASLGLSGRYLQYQVALASSEPTASPALRDIAFSYELQPYSGPAPTVTAIDPASGSTAGGTAITVTGTNFQQGAVLLLGDRRASGIAVESDTTITATTPAHPAGTVDVMVVNPDSQSAILGDAFTYLAPPPVVTAVDPASGPMEGGTTVTISGADFSGATGVSFGGTAAQRFTVDSDTSITAVSPAHAAGPVDVTVTTPSGASAPSSAARFTYLLPSGAPTVSAADPAIVPGSGGTTITITGSNFAEGATVTIGGAAATNVSVVDPATITAVAPAHAAGAADMTVTNPDGRGATLDGGLTYVDCSGGCAAGSTAGDFSAGTTGSDTYVSQTGDGEVTLAPAAGAEFSGSTLPSGWSASPWASGGGVGLSGGWASVDGALLATTSHVGTGRTLDFVATFDPAAPFQHAGLGTDLNGAPWAIFSTGSNGGALYARTNSGQGSPLNTLLPGNWLGSPHHFRIVWTASSVTYVIDGSQVAQHSLAIGGQMRPVASDGAVGGGMLRLDWLRLGPYAASGTYTSPVLDSGGNATWDAVHWTSLVPGGTTIVVSVRTGDTPVPDAAWSDWQAVTNGANLSLGGRYLQYQVDLSTSDPAVTPALRDIIFSYSLSP